MKRKLAAVAILLLLGLSTLVGLVLYRCSEPTSPGKGFARAYEEITLGMTEDEVVSRFRCPPGDYSDSSGAQVHFGLGSSLLHPKQPARADFVPKTWKSNDITVVLYFDEERVLQEKQAKHYAVTPEKKGNALTRLGRWVRWQLGS
jgi:hypothetical protein